jgi:S-adenosylmethionine synthetase
MRNVTVESLERIPVEDQQVELVERKGIGHPDSICDAIMEEISVALCREYTETFGRIVHHNIDKGLLVAGRTSPRIGGGVVDEPMRLVIGDRAIYDLEGKHVAVGDVAERTARGWLRDNLRFVDADKHIVLQNEIKQGSPELTDIFDREVIGANDTSAAVGYAPLTDTEQTVLKVERYLNSAEFKEAYPESGEDIKVMGYRRDRELFLTVAMAFVDRLVDSQQVYFLRKEEIRGAIMDFVTGERRGFDKVMVDLNTLDDETRGEEGVYLTVLGTSAEGADCGQVGRGNKVNGVIALNRPMSTEAAAGKNPVSHVGKIYTLLTHRIAQEIYAGVPGIREVYVWLCSQIGRPIDDPLIASVQLTLARGVSLTPIKDDVERIMLRELDEIYDFTADLAKGEYPVW